MLSAGIVNGGDDSVPFAGTAFPQVESTRTVNIVKFRTIGTQRRRSDRTNRLVTMVSFQRRKQNGSGHQINAAVNQRGNTNRLYHSTRVWQGATGCKSAANDCGLIKRTAVTRSAGAFPNHTVRMPPPELRPRGAWACPFHAATANGKSLNPTRPCALLALERR